MMSIKPLTLAAALVASGVFASPAAHAYVLVTYNTVTYAVDSFTGSYNANAALFNATDMPWWGSQSVATDFAGLVTNLLGLPNLQQSGPLFTWVVNPSGSAGFVFGQSWRSTTNSVALATPPVFASATYAYVRHDIPTNAVPEIDALSGTGALALLGLSLSLAGERRRRT